MQKQIGKTCKVFDYSDYLMHFIELNRLPTCPNKAYNNISRPTSYHTILYLLDDLS